MKPTRAIIARLLIGTLGALLLSGCVIVPIPNRSVQGYGVTGRVIDARTHLPVNAARIEAVEDKPDPRVAFSDAEGEFKLKPRYGWHGGYMYAVHQSPVFPYANGPASLVIIHITAPGYREVKIPVSNIATSSYVEASDISFQRP
jgi:hypothetical protein